VLGENGEGILRLPAQKAGNDGRVLSGFVPPRTLLTCGLCVSISDGEYVVYDAHGDIDAGGVNAVAILHGVVDFVHQQPAILIFQDVHSHDAAADRLRGLPAQLV